MINSKPKLINGAFTVVFSIFFLALLLDITSISIQFTFLEIGRIFGSVLSLIIFLVMPVATIFLLLRKYNYHSSFEKNPLLILTTKKGVGLVSIVILLHIIISVISSTIFFPMVIATRETKIDPFIPQNIEQNLEGAVKNITTFLNNNVKSSYKVNEALFEIDSQLFGSIVDPFLLNSWKISRADVIIHQGWGSCGQAAIVIQELLDRLEYETRRARFIGIDHEWTEVKNDDGHWMIVDPWYIGNLVEIEKLKIHKPAFEKASGVKIIYKNGTIFELSQEHGY